MKNYRTIILSGLTALMTAGLPTILVSCKDSSKDPNTNWVEADSVTAIHNRILGDFTLTEEQAFEQLAQKYPGFTQQDYDQAKENNLIEVMDLGEDIGTRVFYKSVRNYGLLKEFKGRGEDSPMIRHQIIDSVINMGNPAHRILYRYQINVPYNPQIAGQELTVYMPYPMETERQWGIKLISSQPENHYISDPEASVHRTIHFKAPAPTQPGDTAHFEYVAAYDVRGSYFPEDYILKNIQPYDKESDLYRKYTSFEAPHIVNLEPLARQIVGQETSPYRQSEMIYQWISDNFPWAGAREYSTIECIPEYVLERGYGDCGQVALLYISLMRSLGVPATWESGWYLSPGEVGIHDWAKVYYEGIGWVPVDVSFGRFTNSEDPRVVTFYTHGIDPYRLACNAGVHQGFDPAKTYLRSETVDSQVGEVEAESGNLFYPAWSRKMTIISDAIIDDDKE